jgi:hypothetical protein
MRLGELSEGLDFLCEILDLEWRKFEKGAESLQA